MASHDPRNLYVVAAILLLITFARGSCFLPNGTDRNSLYNTSDGSDAYLRCKTTPDGEASMCCRLGNERPDTCRPDGLCQNGNLLWRESCTDSTWKQKGCIKLCIDGSMGNDDIRLKQCDDQSICCDQNGSGDQCCNRGQGKWIDENGDVVNTKPASAASSTMTSSTSAMSTNTAGETKFAAGDP